MIKKLLPEIWKNKKQIAEGIKNLVFKEKDIEELVEYRRSICEKCIWYSENQRNKPYEDIPDIIKEIKDKEWIEELTTEPGKRCLNCGCGLGKNSLKLRCLSCNCPVNAWESVTNNQDEIIINKIIDEGKNYNQI